MTRVLSYGEALVDFLPDRRARLRDVESFSKSIGGAPANAAVGLARLGCDVGLLGKVGADEFGHYLLERLAREGVDTTGVRQSTEAKTGITFISLDESGDRSFLFFREPSADLTLREEDVDTTVIRAATVLVAGSNLLTVEPVRSATWFALETAKAAGAFIVLDPNIRPHLWPQPDELRPTVRRELDYGDIVKLNEDELARVSPDGAAPLWDALRAGGATALVITLAERGAKILWHGGELHVEAPKVEVVDTTGAGDGFVAGFVTALLRLTGATDPATLRATLREFDAPQWRQVLALGCFVGSSVCQKLGATPSLPSAAEVPWSHFGLS